MTTQTLPPLFHPTVSAAFEMLQDPKQCVRRPIIKGRCAGIRDLEHALFVPRGFHRNDFPARFTFDINFGVTTELQVMVSIVSDCDGPAMIFGFHRHDASDELRERGVKNGLDWGEVLPEDAEKLYVAVDFNMVHRDGFVRMSTELYQVYLTLFAEELERASGNLIEGSRREEVR